MPATDIDRLLAPFHQFGVNLGLERIKTLLAAVGNPHRTLPMVHVAGTNGKGSVCAYLESILIAAGYRVGKYTSPHLVVWNERICINGIPIPTPEAIACLERVIKAIDLQQPIPTQFEIVTAAAWVYFATQRVEIGIFEVGLGGRLDATNVCDDPLVPAIVSISREHWQQLGNTLAEIATQKAGILKPHRPVVVGILPAEAREVVHRRAEELQAPLTWVEPARLLPDGRGESDGTIYPLPLLGQIQLSNAAIAIAMIQSLRLQGWKISDTAVVTGMAQTRWAGRIEWVKWRGCNLLIDGAHNPAAAVALRNYIDTLDRPISWTIGMLSTKEHRAIFEALLRSGDRLILVPVPGHSSANPAELEAIARSVCSDLIAIDLYSNLESGLEYSCQFSDTHQPVLSGSLYLLGHFLGNSLIS
jgi:dihydrofolate synthase / folylpolyglutamate synthase